MTQKELGYIELEWTCKHCGTINPGMKRVCINCGAPIGKDDEFELPDKQELITDKAKLDEAKAGPSIQCPYCNTFNPAGTELCIHCGGNIQDGLIRKAGEVLGAYQNVAVPDKPCPSCGQMVKANADRCPFCGGSLTEAKTSAGVNAPPPAKKIPIWMIIGGIAVGILCLAAIIFFAVMSNRTSEVTATVSSLQWWRGVGIEELQPIQQSAWGDEVPAEAQNISCRSEYKETSSDPAPNATEVCGTPYTIDTGSGAGKVVQDCEYQIYASYCEYTTTDWVEVNTAIQQGTDNHPNWPEINLQEGQREGIRRETYSVTFDANGHAYLYSATNSDEFSQYFLGSQWLLDINPFGDIKEISAK